MRGLKQSKQLHRLLVTSRYDVTLPEFDGELQRAEVPALQGAALEKKCQRLAAFKRKSEIDAALQAQARSAADGNPRLLEWLDKVLVAGGVDTEAILQRMAAEEDRFRENILAEQLLQQQSADLRTLLVRGIVFQLPVPAAVMAKVIEAVPDWSQHRDRAIALGLLEVSQVRGQRHLRVPQILQQPLLPAVAESEVWATASDALYQVWWEEADTSTDEQRFELLRLAEAAEQGERAALLGNQIAVSYERRGRYREAIPLLQRSPAN